MLDVQVVDSHNRTSRNRIYQACIEEVQQLEARQRMLHTRYRSLVEKFNMNRTVAFETSTRLTETSDAIKAYRATTEALQAELKTTKERNDELRQQVLAAQTEVRVQPILEYAI